MIDEGQPRSLSELNRGKRTPKQQRGLAREALPALQGRGNSNSPQSPRKRQIKQEADHDEARGNMGLPEFAPLYGPTVARGAVVPFGQIGGDDRWDGEGGGKTQVPGSARVRAHDHRF